MPFSKSLPEWNAVGTSPSTAKKTEGWKTNEKPPAEWFNWWMNTTYQSLLELQQNAVHKDGSTIPTGVFKASSGFVVEVRTSDPVAPELGRIWLRSDL